MTLITGTKSQCAYYDPLGIDTLIDCLECENNDLRIIDDKEKVFEEVEEKIQAILSTYEIIDNINPLENNEVIQKKGKIKKLFKNLFK